MISKEDRAVVWAFVGSLVTVKLVTSIMILYYFPSWHTLLLVVALSIVWFLPPIFYLGMHSKAHARLVRARMRRRELLRQEWDVGEESHKSRV